MGCEFIVRRRAEEKMNAMSCSTCLRIVGRIDSSVWPRDTRVFPCRLQTDWMLDAPYSELDQADVGLEYIVLRWHCPAACKVSWGAADVSLEATLTCIPSGVRLL
jgi:hypothetical protein